MEPKLKSSSVIKRYEHNPILSDKDIPYPANLIFNAGVAKFNGRYVMVFRNDYGYEDGKGFEGTNLGLALSDDGVKWNVQDKPFFSMDMMDDSDVLRLYDPRLTVIDGELFICFAMDTRHGVRGLSLIHI